MNVPPTRMTAQIADQVRHRGVEYKLAGVSGAGLFNPADHGLEPVAMSTACWRGYYCVYEVEDGHLRLAALHIRLDTQAEQRALDGEPLLGVVPEPQYLAGGSGDSAYRYLESLRVAPPSFAVPYTGGLLLGDEFIRDLYVHMGFHPAWKYRRVLELIFDRGALVRETDHSAAAEAFRRTLEQRDPRSEPTSREDIAAWIERTFSLDYSAGHPF